MTNEVTRRVVREYPGGVLVEGPEVVLLPVPEELVQADGLTIRRSVLRLVESCLAEARAFIKPLASPCGHQKCGMYNKHRQCIECGWLRPFTGDVIREMPLGPSRVTRLGLSADEFTYVTRMGV